MKNLSIILFIYTISSTAVAGDNTASNNKAQGGTGLKINDIRTLEFTENTIFKEDGEEILETRAQGGTGYKTRYMVSDTNPIFTSGQLEEVDLINTFKGPLLSVSPLQIFNIDGLTNDLTFFTDNRTEADLQVGDSVLISGYSDINSLAVMTRIEVVNDLPEWKLSGYVENLTASQFSINNQLITYSPSDIGLCDSIFADGVFVEVFAEPVPGFSLQDSIDTVTEINCIDRKVAPSNPSATVIIEGMIDAVQLNGDFILAGQQVEVVPTTRYIRGRAADIQQRIKVEVQGVVDEVSAVLTADKVRFLEARFNLTLPVMPSDLNASVLNVAGVDLRITPQTLDPGNVIPNGLNEPKQLQLRGYGAGDLYVTKIDERGAVDYDDVIVEGEVSAIDRPVIELFGIRIDGSEAVFYDADGLVVSADDFFTMIALNTAVIVEGASYDVNKDLITAGTVSIEDLGDVDGFANTQSKIAEPTLFGVGRITSLPDAIFIGSFD